MKRAFLCSVLVLTVILGGCSWFGNSQPAGPATLVDDFGREIVMEEPAQRVISLVPASTEIMFALGVGDRVVGASEYCNYPEAALDIPRVGAFDAPNIELILSMEPDLVLAASLHKEPVEALEQLGIAVLALDPQNIQEIYANIEVIAAAVGEEEAGEDLINDMKGRLAAVDQALTGLGDAERPKVFYEVWYPGIYTAGEGTFIDEIIIRAGGRNLAWGISRWDPIQEEEVLERNPDYIIHSHYTAETSQFAQREGWDALTAVREGRIYFVDPDITSRTGPRVVDAVEEMARIFHPDRFE